MKPRKGERGTSVLETKQIQIQGQKITVSQANVQIGFRHDRMIGEAVEANKDEPDPDRRNSRFFFANLVAPVIDWDGLQPPTFEEFEQLPEEETNRWFEAVRKLNGHWFNRVSTEEQEKKVPS